jgi:hypothetical protein
MREMREKRRFWGLDKKKAASQLEAIASQSGPVPE